jgi:hypothetical protein
MIEQIAEIHNATVMTAVTIMAVFGFIVLN